MRSIAEQHGLPRGRRSWRRLSRWAAALCACALVPASAAETFWGERFVRDARKVDAATPADVGVYVRDLDTGLSASHRAEDTWYFASMVKVPVAIAVMQGVEQGHFTLRTPLTLRAGDYVDGAGTTNARPVGARIAVGALLEQMIVHSDNTASDMLIDLVGARAVNAVVEAHVPGGIHPITLLSDVRREVYGRLTPKAARLSGRDWIALQREKGDAARMKMLSALTGVAATDFRLPTLGAAYDAYYASEVNSGRLDAYGELLSQLAEGRVLSPASTEYLLGVMDRTATGPRRIRDGLPPGARFAHKTGTQRARFCDAGVVGVPQAGRTQRVVIVACASGDASLARSEQALRDVGVALCRSGLLTHGVPDAPACPSYSLVGRQLFPSPRAP